MSRKKKYNCKDPGAWVCGLAQNPDAEPTPQGREYLTRLERAAFLLRNPAAGHEYAVRTYLGIW